MDTAQSFRFAPGARSRLRYRSKPKKREPLPDNFKNCYIQPYSVRRDPRKDKVTQRVKKYFVSPPGNGCWHNPNEPRHLIPDNPYDTPLGDDVRALTVDGKKYDEFGNRLRSKAQYRGADKAREYYHNVDVIPSIAVARRTAKAKVGQRARLHQSNGRESASRVLSALFMNVDVTTLRIGKPDYTDAKSFFYLTLESIAAQAGVSYSQAKRALKALVDAKVIKRSKQYTEEEDGTYTGRASAMWFSRTFIRSLGLDGLYSRTAKKLHKRNKERKERGYKIPAQVEAEAREALCSSAGVGGLIASLKEGVERDEADEKRNYTGRRYSPT